MNRKIFLIGGGGHAKVLSEILNAQSISIYTIISPDIDKSFHLFKDIQHVESDEELLKFDTAEVCLVNAVGSLPGDKLRTNIFQKFSIAGYSFLSVISERSSLSSSVFFGEGVQIMPGVIVNANVRVGNNSIINSGSILEHDCQIGENVHVAPGVTLCGGVMCGDNVHIGTGANVIQGVTIGCGAQVGAGVTLTTDLSPGEKVYVAKSFFR